jgi:hypothetical protein
MTPGRRSAVRPRVIVSGILFNVPVAGVAYQMLHYLLGLERLGYDAYYVEDTDWWSLDPRTGAFSADPAKSFETAVPFLEAHGFAGRWAYRRCHAVEEPKGCWGMPEGEVLRLYREADALLNVTGCQWIWDEVAECPHRILIESDPGAAQIDVALGVERTIRHLDAHHSHFTFGETLGGPSFPVPTDRYRWLPTRQPVALDLWHDAAPPRRRTFTTVTSWHDDNKNRELAGEVLYWTKDREFLKVLDLAQRRPGRLELAVTPDVGPDRTLLEGRGWALVDGLELSSSADRYRRYITDSWGEFTVARDQYVRLRTGWFSDRSACYLAAGRPVITQETGFSDVLPTGEGLFAWTDLNDAVAALDAIDSGPARHGRAAQDIAQEYFAADRVLDDLLSRAGLR